MKRVFRRIASAAFAVLGAATPAAAQERAFVDCVETLQPAKSLGVAANAIVDARDVGDVTVMQISGAYDRGLAAPRQAVAQRFLQDHPDAYDFLIVFTTFEFETGTAAAFYNTIKNDVAGIGDTLYDNSAAFGSTGRLQGYVDMAATTRYAFDPRDARYEHALNTLAHELMHRWGAGVQYRDAGGNASDALIGRAGRHWSYFLDSDASVMYGSDWRRRADGRYEAVAIRARYSPLDLYMAGFAAASEVPPLTLLRGGDGNVEDAPRLGAITGGTPETVTIEQIVAASGARAPTAADAPKNFRAALIVLTRPGEQVSPQVLFGLETLRTRFQQRFAQMTDSRAMLRIFTERKLAQGPSLPTILAGSGDTASPPGAAAAVAWLESRQAPDGHWEDRAATALRDTVAALRALEALAPASPAIARARAWIVARTAANLDQQAWQHVATRSAAHRAALDAAQAADGGWGLAAGRPSSPFDTATIADLLARTSPDAAALDRALGYLEPRQNANGSFGAVDGGRGRVLPTLRTARLLHAGTSPAQRDAAQRAGAWLASRRTLDGFGDLDRASLAATIEVYASSAQLPLDGASVATARGVVRARQQIAGDWAGSVYLTATAALASALDLRVNYALAEAPRATPSPAFDGDRVRLSATVINTGHVDAPATVARWYDGDPALGAVPIGADIVIDALPAGARRTVDTTWDTTGRAGAHTLMFVVDPDGAVPESRDDDNRAELALTIDAAPVGVDLQLYASDLALDPAAVDALPRDVRLTGIVRNNGTAAASGVRVVLTAVANPAVVLAQATLAVPARGSTPLDLAFTVTDPSQLALSLRADPDGAIAEAREDNNEARLALGFGASLDLEITPADLSAVGAIVAGRDATARVVVRNRGTQGASAASLRVDVVQGATTTTLADTTLAVPAGASVTRLLSWRPATAGTAQLRAVVDGADQVAESNETNNAAQIDIEVVPVQGPDLAVVGDTLEFTPAPALQGRPLLASLRVTNYGIAVDVPFAVALYAGDPRIGAPRIGSTVVDGLAGAAQTVVAIAVADLDVHGEVGLFVRVDADDAVAESDENNNLVVKALQVVPLPDVVVATPDVRLTPALPVTGASVTARVRVRNLGGQDAHGVVVRLGEGDATASTPVGERTIATLPAHGTTEVDWTWTLGVHAGARAVVVDADPADAVREVRDDNNRAVLPYDLQDDALYANERYISPNGDGVRDETAIVFRLDAAGAGTVRIANGLGYVVRTYAGIDANAERRGQIVWDGRDDVGRIVVDGDYRVDVTDAAGTRSDTLIVTVDNNRSSVFEAIGTPHAVEARGWFAGGVPPAASPRSTYAYGVLRVPTDGGSIAALYRADTLAAQPEAVVSERWLRRETREVTNFAFSADGAYLAFTAPRGTLDRAYVADAAGVDAIAPLQADDDAEPRTVVGWLGDDEVVLRRQNSDLTDVVDRRTRALRPFHALPAGRTPTTTRWGVLLADPSRPRTFLQFLPRDTASPVVELASDEFVPGVHYETQANADRSRVLLHVRTPTRETLELVDLAHGRRVMLVDRPNDASASPLFVDEPGSVGSVRELAFEWIEPRGEIVVADGRARALLRYDADGAALGRFDLPAVDRAGPYSLDPHVDLFAHAFAAVDAHPHCLELPLEHDARRVYDPATQSLLVRLKEVVGVRHFVGSEHYAAYYDGIAQFVAANLDTQTTQIVATGSAVPLALQADRKRHPALSTDCPARHPPDWPELILHDGARLLGDGRILTPSRGTDGEPWRYAAQLADVWPDAERLALSTTPPRTVTSLLNGYARIEAIDVDGAFALSGVAADRSFAYYELDYATSDAPTEWHPIQPASSDEVRLGEFLTWLPPTPGVYTVRLRVVDRAGNVTTATTTLTARRVADVDRFAVDPRHFSPNGDGVKDATAASFHVRRPATLSLVVKDTDGVVVYRNDQTYGATGPQSLAWDGRDAGGTRRPDGRYRVEIGGFAAWVVLDTTAPTVEATVADVYAAFLARRTNVPSSPLRIAAADANGVQVDVDAISALDGSVSRVVPGPFLPMATYATSSLRVTATDPAGNRTVRTADRATQRLVLFDGGDLYPRQALPWNATTLDVRGDTPARLIDEDTGGGVILVMPGVASLRYVGLQYALRDDPQSWSAPSLAAPVPYECDYCFLLPKKDALALQPGAQGLQRGGKYFMRAVAERDDGTREFSNMIPAELGGIGVPTCSELFDGFAVADYNEGSLRSATLYYAYGDGVHRGSIEAGRIRPQGAFFAFGLESGATYDLRVVAIDTTGRRHERTGRCQPPGGGGNSGSSLGVVVKPFVVDRCDGVPTDRVVLDANGGLASPPSFFRWRYVDGHTLETMRTAPQEAVRTAPPPFELSTRDWAPGTYDGALEAGYGSGDAIEWRDAATFAIPVEKTAPRVAIGAPANGMRVCSADVREIVGSVDSPSRAGYLVSVGTGAAPASWSCRDQKGLAPAPEPQSPQRCRLEHGIAAATDIYGAPATNGVLASFPQGVLDTYNGVATIRVQAVNWSGGPTCATTSLYVDGAVEIAERALSPQRVVFDGRIAVAVAPHSTGIYRTGQVLLRANEAVDVVARVHAATMFAPPIGTIATLTAADGDIDVEWDGRVAGTVVADGMYQIRITATDACGHTQTLSYPAYVKSAPPTVAFAQPAEGATVAAAVVDIRGTAEDALLERWSLDVQLPGSDGTAPIASGTTPMRTTGGAVPQLAAWSRGQLAGPVTLRLAARDVFGNTAVATRPIVLDAPATLIAAAAVNPLVFSPNADGVLDAARVDVALRRDATIAVRVKDAAQAVVATLYHGAASDGAHGYAWDGRSGGAALPDGAYAIEIEAIDTPAGIGPEYALLSATIDTTAPQIALVAPTSGFLSRPRTIRYDVDDVHLAAYEATLSHGGAIVASTQGTIGGALALGVPADAPEGAYVLRIAARDRAGNRSEKLFDFILDATPPVVALDAPPDGAVLPSATPTSVRGTVRDDHLASYDLSVVRTGGDMPLALANGTTPLDAAQILAWTPNRPDGDYRLSLVGADRAGNVVEAAHIVTIDRTPPVATIAQPADGAFVRRTFDVGGTATDAHFVEYRVALTRASSPDGPWSDVYVGTSPVDASRLASLDLAQPGGDYLVRLTVTDRAGHVSTAQVRVRLDTEPPPAPLSLTGRVDDNRHALLAWSPVAAADLAGYHVYRGGARITPAPVVPAQYADRDAPEGVQRYTVTAVDHAGNESAPSNAVALSIDHTAPAASLLRPADGERVRGLVDIVGTAWSRDDFREYRVSVEPLQPSGAPVELRRSPLPVQTGTLASWNTTALADETRVRLRLDAQDRSGNVAVAHAEVTVDNLAPAAPTGVAAALATSPDAPCATLGGGARDVRVCWNANVESDLLGYLVYRGGVLLGAPRVLPPDLRPYAIPDPAWLDGDIADGAHTYVVHAIDRAGNISAPSDPVALAPIENGAPDLAFVAPAPGDVFDRSIAIHATSAHRDIATVQFAARRVGESAWTDIGTALTSEPYGVTWTPGALPFGDYDIRGIATDTAGNADATPPLVRVTYADLTSPDAPTALTARADGDTVTLAWTASVSSDVARYELSRYNGQWWETVDGVPTAATTHVDAGRGDGEWRYRVVAIDAYGNRSAPSNDAVATVFSLALAQPYSPTTVGTVDIGGRSARSGSLAIRVENAQGGTDLAPVALDVHGTIALAALALQPGENRFVLRVTDAQGHRSREAELWVTRGAAPAAPTGVAANVAGHDVTITWTPNAEPDVTGYRVFRRDRANPVDAALDATFVATSVGGYAPEAAVDGDPQTAWEATHEYGAEIENDRDDPVLELAWPSPRLVVAANLTWLSAQHAAGNVDVQGWSGRAWITLARVRGDALASQSVVPATPYRTDRIRLVVRGPGHAGLFDYRLAEIALVERPLLDATTLTDTLIDGRYDYRVSAVNALGFESERSAPVTADIGDAVAPDAVVLSGSVTGNVAQLSWTASAAPDVASYVLRRNGSSIATLAAGAPRAWTDAGLANGAYAYAVVAVDAFDNASASSNVVTLTIADGGPGVPQNPRVVAPRDGAALDLAWDAGSGNAPATYVVRRASAAAGPFADIARVAATTYRDAPLANGTTVWYTVEAIDAAGNASGPSAPVAGTPRDTRAPVPPLLSYPTVAGTAIATQASMTLVCGVAEPGSRVAVERDGIVVAEATARAALAESSLTLGTTGDIRVLPAPDGRHYALESSTGIVSYADIDGGGSVVSTTAKLARWARHGLALYYADLASGAIERVEPGRDPTAFGIAATDLRAFAVSADETRLLFVGSPATGGTPTSGVWIANVDGTGARRIDGIDAADVWGSALEFSPDGRHALIGTFALQLHLVDLQTARVVETHTVDSAAASAWSPDGRYAFVTRNANDNADVYVARVGDAPRLLASEPTGIGVVSWSPDGTQLLVAASEFLDVVDAADGRSTIGGPLADPGSPVAVWTASGRIVAKPSPGPLRLIDPPGTFCSDPVGLVAPLHRFGAIARDAAGNASLPAAPVDVRRSATTLPDLAIGAPDVLVVPADLRPGDTASMLVTLRNAGAAHAPESAMRATLAAPDGTMRTLATAPVPPLDGGAAYATRIDLGVLDSAGTWRVAVVLDAPAQIVESSETNNRAEAPITVVGTEAVLEVHADRALFAPGDAVTGTVVVAGVERPSRVRVAAIDADGAVVDELGDYAVPALARTERWTQSLRWTADGVLAGSYRLRARLFDANGALQAERTSAFAIAAVRHVDLELEPEPAAANVGATLRVRGEVAMTDGNAPIDGARLRLVAVTPASVEIGLADRPLGTLLPGYRMRDEYAWNTAGLAPGTYTLRLALLAPGFATTAERSVVLDAATPTIALAGELQLAPGLSLVAGIGGEVRYVVANRGDVALSGVEARVRVVVAGATATLAQTQQSFDLAAGASDAGTLAIAAPPLTFAAHAAVLEARLPGDAADAWRPLARLGFSVVDAVAPEVVLLTPPAGIVQPAVVPLRASVVDRHSALAAVEFRVDGGAWQPVGLGADGIYARGVAGLADGTHRIVVRARDAWGNETSSDERTFDVDATPPAITIDGVADGDLVNRTLAPTVAVVEASAHTTDIRLNGAPYVSGTTIAADGDYVLSVRATDEAGNTSLRAVRFGIDRSVPTVVIVEPADGTVVAQSTIAVVVRTEASATATLTVGAWHADAIAGADGLATYTSVPLSLGDNAVAATARDRAGNVGGPAAVAVRYEPPQSAAIVGTLQPATAQLPHGEPLVVSLRAENGGATPLAAQRLRVRAATPTQVLAEQTVVRDFAAGEIHTVELTFASADWPLGAIDVTLELDRSGTWTLLDREAVDVVDRTPPIVAAIAPIGGAVLRSPVVVRATASDALSGIASVDARIDGAAWIALASSSGEYASAAQTLSDGAHEYELRATDGAGNIRTAAAVAFAIDNAAPAIAIAGVADGDLVAQPVTPTVTITDAHPATQAITLNGAPFVSGTTILSGGHYVLAVDATDRAGNAAQKSIAFTIDRDAPVVVITSPADGATVDVPTIAIAGTTEPLAQVDVSVGMFAATVFADADGAFAVASASLAPGANTIAAHATDRAGNVGAPTSIVVTYVPPAAPLLDGEFGTIAPLVAVGSPLLAPYTVRNPGATAVGNVPVRVQLFADGVAEPVASREEAVSLGAQAAQALDASFATDAFAPGVYRLRLEAWQAAAGGAPAWRVLDEATTRVRVACRDRAASFDQLFWNGFDLFDRIFCSDFETIVDALSLHARPVDPPWLAFTRFASSPPTSHHAGALR